MLVTQLLKHRMNEQVYLQLPDNGRYVLVEQGRMTGINNVLFLNCQEFIRFPLAIPTLKKKRDGNPTTSSGSPSSAQAGPLTPEAFALAGYGEKREATGRQERIQRIKQGVVP